MDTGVKLIGDSKLTVHVNGCLWLWLASDLSRMYPPLIQWHPEVASDKIICSEWKDGIDAENYTQRVYSALTSPFNFYELLI